MSHGLRVRSSPLERTMPIIQWENLLGEYNSYKGTISLWGNHVIVEIQPLRELFEAHNQYLDRGEGHWLEGKQHRSMRNDFKQTLQSLQYDMAVLKRAVVQGKVCCLIM